MPKALLILFGGRSMPNVFTMINEKPDLIVAIVSKDYQHEIKDLKRFVETILTENPPLLDVDFIVDAFTPDDIRSQCKQAVAKYPGYDWVFNITSGTAIMSIGGYEAAKDLIKDGSKVDCWYMDTRNTNVVSLFDGRKPDDTLFDISIDQYVTAYNCRLESGNVGDSRILAEEKWLPFAEKLVQQPENMKLIKKMVSEINKENAQKKKGRTEKSSTSVDRGFYTFEIEDAYTLLEFAYSIGLINGLSRDGNVASMNISREQFNFLNGAWLEVYVWNQAQKLNLFTDCHWNQKLYSLNRPQAKENLSELDVSMIHKGQLLIVECKAGSDAFKADTLAKLDSIAGTLGGNFVTKILVTSLPESDCPNLDHFKDLKDARRIVVVTQEQLNQVGEYIRKEVKNPKHVRA